MRFYNKYYADCFGELLSYYPRFYRDVYEMSEILKAQGTTADRLEDNIEQVYLNCFIDYADAGTIEKLEGFLGLGHNRAKSLEMRREIIKAHFFGSGKISASLVVHMLKAYTTADMDVELRPCRDGTGAQALYITLSRDGTQELFTKGIRELLGRKLPAHVRYVLSDYTGTALDNRSLEKGRLSSLGMCMGIPFWDTGYLDGTGFLDGSLALDKKRYACAVRIQCNCGQACCGEKAGRGHVVTQRNPHFLDGSLCLSGVTALDSYYKMEAL